MPGLADAMSRCPVPSLLIIGDADPHYDPTALETLNATTKPEVLVIPGADHSLDIPGNLTASIAALHQAMQAVERFLARGNSAG
jgi:dienelactone hydrolase